VGTRPAAAAVAFAGVVTALLVWWVMGTLHRVPLIMDEAAYLLQGQIFAGGHWAAPAPPLPEFFEQLYVLVTPVVASKYPPGESLALAPAVWVGLPGLLPVLVGGLTGALLFALAWRVAGGWVALCTWLVWLGTHGTLYARAMYMSEGLSALAWLVAWWGLLVWWSDRRASGLTLAAAAIAVAGITRPLSALALAAPVGVVAAALVWRRREWRAAAVAALVGLIVCAVVPLWSVETTGRWWVTPLALYTRQYMPFERLGFGAGVARPLRALPYDLWLISRPFFIQHRDYHLAAVPRALADRLMAIGVDVWGGWRLWLLPCAIVALVRGGAILWFAVATFAAAVAVYLAYAHPGFYTLYYLEAEPVLAFVTAVGLVWLLGRWPAALGAAVTALALTAVITARDARDQTITDESYYRRAAATLAGIPDPRSLVFVRYAPAHNANLSLVRNVPDPASAPMIVAYDHGADDARLIALYPDRVPYLFDEAAWTLTRINGPSR
jgi:hypothetical protein